MNPEMLHLINIVFCFGAILLQVFSVAALGILFFGNKKHVLLNYIERNFLIFGFLISLSAILVSLFYSEIVGFAPCFFCWWQRIFIFPLAFMFAVALWDKDKKVLRYSLPLIIIGFCISVYHNLGYYFGENSGTPCDSSGVSCYQHLVSELGGYISIPMLSLTGFLSLLTLCLVVHFRQKNSN